MRKSNILFVDDEERILRSLSILFRTNPEYEVHTATHGNAALDIVRQHRIDVVVSDQRMPQITGVELLGKIKELSPNTMRILLTGYADLNAIVSSINEGEVFRYITKPWTNTELKETVKKAASIANQLFAAEKLPKVGRDSSADTKNKDGIMLLMPNQDKQDLSLVVEKLFEGLYPIYTANSMDAALDTLTEQSIAAIVADLANDHDENIALLKLLKREYPLALTIALTNAADADTAISLINEGQVYRYLPKPVAPGLLRVALTSALKYYQLCQSKPEQLMRHQVENSKQATEVSANSSFLSKISALRKRMRSMLSH